MPRFLADEGFNWFIVRGLRDRDPDVNIILVQDVGLTGAADPVILEWAAGEGLIVLTHDKRTMTRDANARLVAGLPMPGVVVVHWETSPGIAIAGLRKMIGASLEGDWENQIRYIERR